MMIPMAEVSMPVASPGRSPKPLRADRYEQMIADASQT
jgi:hypothetical protein